MKKYRIRNKSGNYLTGFYPNGGWKIKDVFACSRKSWFNFQTMDEAIEYLQSMKKRCIEQSERWGDWLDVALKYVKSLDIESIEVKP